MGAAALIGLQLYAIIAGFVARKLKNTERLGHYGEFIVDFPACNLRSPYAHYRARGCDCSKWLWMAVLWPVAGVWLLLTRGFWITVCVPIRRAALLGFGKTWDERHTEENA